MTILDFQRKYFEKIDRFDLDLILEDVLKKPRAFILAHPEQSITKNRTSIIDAYAKRRIKGEPLAYILGHKEFFGSDFIINKYVLVPRPETELMVEEILAHLTTGDEHPEIIDVGTGSGCIAITLAKKSDNEIIAIDISSRAISIARKNAKLNGVANRIKFVKSDLLETVLGKKKMTAGNRELLIAANLPYLEDGWKNLLKSTETRGLKFEPSIALYSGKDGLDHYRRLAGQVENLREKTKRPITLFCEIGHKQAGGMKKIFSFAGKIKIKKDHNCYHRLAIINI